MSDGPVIGWVDGVAVPAAALAPFMSDLAGGPVGARLGVTDDPALLAAQSPSKSEGLRTWGAKALLVDTFLRHEAARLGVRDPASAAEWLARLDDAQELPVEAPTEPELRAAYASNKYRFEVKEARRVRHVVVGDRATAQRLQGEVPDAGRLAAWAAAWSTDRGSANRGGEIGWVERGQLAGPLEEAIYGAPLGRVVGPVASAFGWHLLVVEEAREPRFASFAECRAELDLELRTTRHRRSWLAWMDRRMAETVRVPDGSEHPLYRGLPGSPHRH